MQTYGEVQPHLGGRITCQAAFAKCTISDAALARLRKALEAKQNQSEPRPENLARFRWEIEDLEQKIDKGAERVLEAPPDLVPVLYRKLEEWRTDRNRLNAELEARASRQTRPDRKSSSEIEQTIDRLKTLSKQFKEASSEEMRDLIFPLVSRIELHFRHETTSGGRERSVFSHGMIHFRADAGEARSTNPKSCHLNNNGWYCGQVGAVIRFTAADLQRKAG